MIAIDYGTFHQKNQGAQIQGNGNDNLKHNSNILAASYIWKAPNHCASSKIRGKIAIFRNKTYLMKDTQFIVPAAKAVKVSAYVCTRESAMPIIPEEIKQ